MNSDEYRKKLTAKLCTLIAVLEVAIIKIEKSISLPSSDEARLEMIQTNLKNTLAICQRAKSTLGGDKQPAGAIPSGVREYTEMSTVEEYRKFQNLPPIELKDIAEVDLMDLCKKLQED